MKTESYLKAHFDANKEEFKIVSRCVKGYNKLQDKILLLEKEIKDCQKRQRQLKHELDNVNDWCYVIDDYIIENYIRLDGGKTNDFVDM